MSAARVIERMWDRRSLQSALLGPPAGSEARQIIFRAAHLDRRQFEFSAPEPAERALVTTTEKRRRNKPSRAALNSIRLSFFRFR
jgi:hypothetical protein